MINKNIIAVKNLIRCLSLNELKNYDVVSNLIRAFGIVQWGPDAFGDDEMFKNSSENMAGIYQTPDQLSKALVYLSDFEINSYCEVGTFQGGAFVFMSEYLRRFNPKTECLTIDPTHYLNPEIDEVIRSENYMSFRNVNSDHISGQQFDLCFLDGDHSEKWINKDWENVGKHAKICMIHDIQELSCPAVIEFWNKIKTGDSVEFLDHTSQNPSQGIGIIHP